MNTLLISREPLATRTEASMIVNRTAEELATWMRSCLRMQGLIIASASVQESLRRDGQVTIQFNCKGCLAVFKTTTLQPGQILVEPELHCWVENEREREELMAECAEPFLQLLANMEQLPWQPVEPTSNELDAWFEYYHACKRAKVRFRLKDIAEKLGYSKGYIRQQHCLYKIDQPD